MNDRPIELAPSRRTTQWTITILIVLSIGMVVYRALEEGDEEPRLPNPGPLHPAAIPPTLPPPPPLSSLEAERSIRVTSAIDRHPGRHRLEWERGQRVRVVVEESEIDARLELEAPSGARMSYDQRDLEVDESGTWTVHVIGASGERGEYTLRFDVL